MNTPSSHTHSKPAKLRPKNPHAHLGQFDAALPMGPHKPEEKPDTRLDKFIFFGVIILMLGVTVPLILFPQQGADWVAAAKTFITDTFGVFYLALGVVAVIFVIFISFSDIGSIKLGRPEDEMEFKTASWAAMIFCGGIGASILYWGIIEWAYYYQGPPFDIAPGSPDAIRWASTYGIFHWGPVAWSIYLIPAIPIAYFAHVRNSPQLKISQSLMPLFGEKFATSNWGKLTDIFFVFGMIGGGATTLGLASPMINEGLYELFGLPKNLWMQLVVLLLTTAIFAYSAFKGLKSGIQFLSNVNFYLALVFVVFVLLAGPTVFILNTGLEAMGRSLTQMFTMMTWTESFGRFPEYGFTENRFPKDWTIFYWAWWLVFAPTIGLFIAKISKGRTIRQMIVGSIFFGSLGCAVFFIVLGNYALYQQLSGSLDVVGILNESGATAAIFAVLNTLPFPVIVIAVFTVLAVIFTATTFDSISFILAAVTQREVDDEPKRRNRLFWAFALCFMPAVLLFLGGLQTLQTASIVAGAPLIVIMFMMMASIIKAANYDLRYQPDYSLKTIHIEEVAESAPWELGETSAAPEGSVLKQQEIYEETRRQEEEQKKEREEIQKAIEEEWQQREAEERRRQSSAENPPPQEP